MRIPDGRSFAGLWRAFGVLTLGTSAAGAGDLLTESTVTDDPDPFGFVANSAPAMVETNEFGVGSEPVTRAAMRSLLGLNR